MKYNTFDEEQDKNYKKKHKPFSKEKLHYNLEKDDYERLMGQKMHKTYQNKRIMQAGYTQEISHYQAKKLRRLFFAWKML